MRKNVYHKARADGNEIRLAELCLQDLEEILGGPGLGVCTPLGLLLGRPVIRIVPDRLDAIYNLEKLCLTSPWH